MNRLLLLLKLATWPVSALPCCACAHADANKPADVAKHCGAPVEQAGLNGLDLSRLQQMLANREITSAELVRLCLARIEAYDDEYGAEPGLSSIVQINQHALDEARRLDEERTIGQIRSPFHGIPVLFKEIFNIKGMYTPAGFGGTMREIVAPSDALIVQKLRTAGAIILGHTDGGYNKVGNPFDQTLNPGGSSSGNGAAVAAAFVPVAVGEDSMGSSRVPAAWTSTVGFRPTTGLVSMQGAASGSVTYDTPGPQATTVKDVAQLMDVIAGFDPSYPASARRDVPLTYTKYLDKTSLSGRKIGIYTPFMRASDAKVRRVIENAAEELRNLGAKVVPLDEALLWIPRLPAGTELLLEMAGLPGLNYTAGFEDGSEYVPTMDRWLSTLQADTSTLAQVAPPLEKLTTADLFAASGRSALPLPATPADYHRNAQLRRQLRDWFNEVVRKKSVDAIIYPTVRTLPGPRSQGFTFHNTCLAALLGYPAISVPAGFVDGLPVGLDIMGTEPGQDAEIIGMGYAYEQGTRHRLAPASTPPLAGEACLGRSIQIPK